MPYLQYAIRKQTHSSVITDRTERTKHEANRFTRRPTCDDEGFPHHAAALPRSQLRVHELGHACRVGHGVAAANESHAVVGVRCGVFPLAYPYASICQRSHAHKTCSYYKPFEIAQRSMKTKLCKQSFASLASSPVIYYRPSCTAVAALGQILGGNDLL